MTQMQPADIPAALERAAPVRAMPHGGAHLPYTEGTLVGYDPAVGRITLQADRGTPEEPRPETWDVDLTSFTPYDISGD